MSKALYIVSVRFCYRTIFTALHEMQTRSSDEKAVCPSVRPSVRLSNG